MGTGFLVKTLVLFDPSQTASGKGPWLRSGRLLSPTLTVEGLETGGTVSLRMSNRSEGSAPDDADDGAPHPTLGAVTANGGGALGGSYTWVRAIKTAGAGATATKAYINAQIPK